MADCKDSDGFGSATLYTFALSVFILRIGMSFKSDSVLCERFLLISVIAVGIFLMVISIVALVGFFVPNSCIFRVYFAGKLLLLMFMLSFIIFLFVVTTNGEEEAVSEGRFKEHKLEDYSNWLRKRVDGNGNWVKIRASLVDKEVCKSLRKTNATFGVLYAKNLSSIESGCCKPPIKCNYQYVSPTVWIKNTTVATSTNSDCRTWNNSMSSLCYDCQSCKAGVAAHLKTFAQGIAVLFGVFLFLKYFKSPVN